MLEQLKKYRIDLHQIPELGFEEYKTKAYIMAIIKDFDCTIHEVGETGLVLYFNCDQEKTIAFRADMDALPIQEATGLTFSSRHSGIMHACGHDGHMAILIGLAQYIHHTRQTLDKNVVLIFQPSEERDAGAQKIVDSGLLEKYKIEAIFGLHLWPSFEKGQIYSRANEFMAMASEVTITIYGKAAHVADSKKGIDALHIACDYLSDLYEMETTLPEAVYRLLKFGECHSGSVRNAISDQTVLYGTLRSFTNEIHHDLKKQIQAIATKYEEAHGCQIQIEYNDGYDAVINDPQLLAYIYSKIPSLKLLENPVMQSEDFSLYRQICPSLFFFLGVGETAPLHNDCFDFEMDVLQAGLDLFVDILTAD